MEKGTTIKSASVKVMLSYDYNHFESCMSVENEDGLTMKDIDDARKNCQRLCDKAIIQYKAAKSAEQNKMRSQMEKEQFERKVERIKMKSYGERTVDELAIIKAYEDENWIKQFDYDYDYDEHDDIPF